MLNRLIRFRWYNRLVPSEIRSLAGFITELSRASWLHHSRGLAADQVVIVHDRRQLPFITKGADVMWIYGSWRGPRVGFSICEVISPAMRGRMLGKALESLVRVILSRQASTRRAISRLFWLAVFEELFRYYSIRRVCVIAHFHDYVFAVSELRRRGAFRELSGVQHGAFEWRAEAMKCHFDAYLVNSEIWVAAARRHFGATANIRVSQNGFFTQWRTRPSSNLYSRQFVAVAWQDDDLESDLMILRAVRLFAGRRGMDVVLYPHPRTPRGVYAKEVRHVQVEEKYRWTNSCALITRYSSLGIEFARFGPVVFVDCGVRLDVEFGGSLVCCSPREIGVVLGKLIGDGGMISSVK